MDDNHHLLVTVGRAAKLLGVSTQWLRDEAAADRIPHLKAGDAILVDFPTLEKALLVRAQQQKEDADREHHAGGAVAGGEAMT